MSTEWVEVQPLVDDAEQRAFWEPWSPKIGDRVRYRWRPECPGVYGLLGDDQGHPPAFDRQVGRVYDILTDVVVHRYMCDFSGHLITAAAIELEPLS